MIYRQQAVIAMLLPVLAGAVGCSSKTGESSGSSAGHVAVTAEQVGAATDPDLVLLAKMLQPRTAKADLMRLNVPPDTIETADKIREFARRNPVVYEAISRKKDADGHIVFDDRIGVTREAFDRMNRVGELCSLTKAGEFELTISRPSFDSAVLLGVPEFPTIEIQFRAMQIKTKYGDMVFGKRVEPNGKQFLTGPVRGIGWNSNEPPFMRPADRFVLSKAAISVATETGDLWMYFSASKLADETSVERYIRVLADSK
jgi:hypothetical protein